MGEEHVDDSSSSLYTSSSSSNISSDEINSPQSIDRVTTSIRTGALYVHAPFENYQGLPGHCQPVQDIGLFMNGVSCDCLRFCIIPYSQTTDPPIGISKI